MGLDRIEERGAVGGETLTGSATSHETLLRLPIT
jgi:hypothetical protein